MKLLLAMTLAASFTLLAQLSGRPLAEIPREEATIYCGEEGFPVHVQGIAADESGIYWSYCDTILKTDWNGRTIKKVSIPLHAGDCCFADGKLFVSVCYLKKSQAVEEGGTGWCYIYDKDLNFLKKEKYSNTPAPDGIVWLNDKLYVSNDDFGPEPHPFNYIQIYDKEFKFLKSVKVDYGVSTHYGAQTLNVVDDAILAAFYAKDNHSPFLREGTLEVEEKRFPFSPNIGMAAVPKSICGDENVYVIDLGIEKKTDDGKVRYSAKLLIRQYVDGILNPFDFKKP